MRPPRAVLLVVPLLSACGIARSTTVGSNDGGLGDVALGDGNNLVLPACPDGGGLLCYVPQGCTTSLSGTVYDPAGHNPIFDAIVYVPSDPLGVLSPILPGATSGDPCDMSVGRYVTVISTDPKGHFNLRGVPATARVPLVVQSGKWRRGAFLPPIPACADNPGPAPPPPLPRHQRR